MPNINIILSCQDLNIILIDCSVPCLFAFLNLILFPCIVLIGINDLYLNLIIWISAHPWKEHHPHLLSALSSTLVRPKWGTPASISCPLKDITLPSPCPRCHPSSIWLRLPSKTINTISTYSNAWISPCRRRTNSWRNNCNVTQTPVHLAGPASHLPGSMSRGTKYWVDWILSQTRMIPSPRGSLIVKSAVAGSTLTTP